MVADVEHYVSFIYRFPMNFKKKMAHRVKSGKDDRYGAGSDELKMGI